MSLKFKEIILENFYISLESPKEISDYLENQIKEMVETFFFFVIATIRQTKRKSVILECLSILAV